MKKSTLLAAILLCSSISISAGSVTVVTSCGYVTSTIDRATYYATGQDADGESYDDYLRAINYIKCGTSTLPRVFEEVPLD